MKGKKKPEPDAKCWSLLIRVDRDLADFAFLYAQKGPLPVVYPGTAITPQTYGGGYQIDREKGGVAFMLKGREPVKVSIDTEAIVDAVRDFLTKVKEGGA